jgi:DNA-binding transcriptional ArsR family regulator
VSPRRGAATAPAHVDPFAPAFDALGDPTRRRILTLLAEGEQTVGTLVTLLQPEMPMSQPAVSQHLKVLRDARLVTARADGTRRLHSLDPVAIRAATGWLDSLAASAPFTQPLDALATEVARGRRSRRRAG